MAVSAKLPNASRRDSQGICFLGNIDYNAFIRRHLGERQGAIVELETRSDRYILCIVNEVLLCRNPKRTGRGRIY